MNLVKPGLKSIFFGISFVAILFTLAATGNPGASNEKTLPRQPHALYETACAACHGVDGTGAPSGQLGFEVPLPDFTNCDFASREADGDWILVTAEGGPARGFSRLMPAFGDTLTREQIEKILGHIRSFCQNREWPRGELNLPRPLVTTKAFPEDELVFSTAVKTEGPDKISNEIIYEQRFGARNQLEVIFPFGWSEQEDDDGDTEWRSSVGDIGVGLKRVIFDDLEWGTILSLGGEVLLPTGDEEEGFGNGTTVFEPYLALGQILPAQFFAHFQAGFVLPYDDDDVNEEVFWRGVLGRSFFTGRYDRRWSPMIEILGSDEMVSGGNTRWDAVPQLQVTLNRRQHVRLCAGARIPLNDTGVREHEFLLYLQWDWFDGGFFEGW